jgi:sugar O-acyltransferase (sialic acid O-acetyltransferase NeuD family)
VRTLVYGSGEFGRVVAALVRDMGHAFEGYVDDVQGGPEVLGSFEQCLGRFTADECAIALAVGYRWMVRRRELLAKVSEAGFATPTLVHPRAVVAPTATVERATFVMAGAIIDSAAVVGEQCVLWPGVIVNHDAQIGANTFLAPGAVICGAARIGSDCFIGAGAVVTDHVTLPDGSFVKAGAVFHSGCMAHPYQPQRPSRPTAT